MWSKLLIAQAVMAAAIPLTSRNPASILLHRDGIAASAPIFSCAASNWPPNTVGKVNEPQKPSDDLASILQNVDPARIEATIKKLVSFGTRHTLSTQTSKTHGIGAARDWLLGEYQKIANASNGRLSVETISYVQEPASSVPNATLITDIVSTLHGTDENRLYVISGHYDSRATDILNSVTDAPGADDDGSGVAVALELARVMSRPDLPVLKGSVAFVAVAGEEEGLYGSKFLAQTYANSTPRANIEGMINNDIVGSPTGDDGTVDPHIIRLFAQSLPPLNVENSSVRETRLQAGGESDTPTRNLARFVKEVGENANTDMEVALIYRLDRFLRSGDHLSFINEGYPAIRFTEPRENFNHQHQDVRVVDGVQYGDLPEFLDYDYIARVARVNGAALWSLASSPGAPTNVRVDTSTSGNNSTLYWDPPLSGEENVGAYEVVWRPTAAPYWTDVVDVGLVNQATLTASKDSVIFGVRTRSADGHRGVAVFPFPS
ncbi:hypothetical protein GGR50DRAFT_699726 [Xylaria sp. CBS 124048]|nr:hypothetical protein GGR50DRAFT_699726 [Xylaria sp. CBS 124048]